MTLTKDFEIINQKGLHARASAKFVEVVEQFDARCDVEKDGMSAAGDSIMGLLMLAASVGSTIRVRIDGPQAEDMAAALTDLIADRFGEDM